MTISDMMCPYCGNPMEKGSIEDSRGLVAWTPVGHKRPFLFPAVQGKTIIIADSNGGPLLGSVVFAYLCRPCSKIVIDVAGTQGDG